jgi:hypothetical protein
VFCFLVLPATAAAGTPRLWNSRAAHPGFDLSLELAGCNDASCQVPSCRGGLHSTPPVRALGFRGSAALFLKRTAHRVLAFPCDRTAVGLDLRFPIARRRFSDFSPPLGIVCLILPRRRHRPGLGFVISRVPPRELGASNSRRPGSALLSRR